MHLATSTEFTAHVSEQDASVNWDRAMDVGSRHFFRSRLACVLAPGKLVMERFFALGDKHGHYHISR
jgi:hypothetical protein